MMITQRTRRGLTGPAPCYDGKLTIKPFIRVITADGRHEKQEAIDPRALVSPESCFIVSIRL
jgi:hypothetical protein